jgi:hypothetical protein
MVTSRVSNVVVSASELSILAAKVAPTPRGPQTPKLEAGPDTNVSLLVGFVLPPG